MSSIVLQDILDAIAGTTTVHGGDLNHTVYLQQIRDAILGVSGLKPGSLHEIIYLQQIRNAILGVPDGQFGSLPASIYLQQIVNAYNGVTAEANGNLDEGIYYDEIAGVAGPPTPPFSFSENYIVYTDDFPNLTGWTVAGTVTASGGVVTFTDIGAGSEVLSRTLTFPTTYPFLVEFIYSVQINQKLQLSLRTANGATLLVVATINNTNGTITLLSQGTGSQTITPSNWDYTARSRFLIWVDPVNRVARFYHAYKDTVNLNESITEIGAAFSWGWTDALGSIYFATGSANAGNATLESLKIYRNFAVIIGDSLATGHNGYSPVPNFYSPNQRPYSIDSYMESDRGNLVRVINQGRGGETTTTLAARINSMVVRNLPKYVIFVIGTNDIFAGTALATTQANMGTIADACNVAGIKCAFYEVAPRNGFDATQNAKKDAFNAWLPGFCTSKNAIRLQCHDALEDPANPDKLLPAYTDDDIHPNGTGYRVQANSTKINSIT